MLSRRELAQDGFAVMLCAVPPVGPAGATALWPHIARLKLAAIVLAGRIPDMPAQFAEYAGHIVDEAEALPYLTERVSRDVFVRYYGHIHVIGGYASIIEHVAEDAELAWHGQDIYAGAAAMLDRLQRLKETT